MKTVGETLREWRKSKLYTQECVANRLKISTSYLHKIENGESYPCPKLTRIMQHFYNCNCDEIKRMIIDEKVNKYRTSLRKKYLENKQ
jgi:transcriptional regulator with XRE-family HTH domain